jgi:HAD superfamily hydrolase (TIGR01509 family)
MQQNVLTLVGLSPDRTSHETKMIKAILFDAFGTLAEIAERRRPYAKLLSLADTESRPTDADYAAIVMGRDWKIHEITDWLGVTQTQAQGAGVFEGLATELLSMSLFPETAEILAHLRACGLKLGICSNLAQPYAAPLRSLLPIEMDEYVWSFEVGAIKPDPIIYQTACDALKVKPEEILMVGDTFNADCLGPRRFGMQAVHLARAGHSPDRTFLKSLSELHTLLGARR